MLLGDSPAEIYHMIRRVARRRALTRKTVYNLYNQFHGGDRKTTGDTGPGVSRTQATEENKNRLRDLLLEDDEWTSEELATYLNVSQSTVLRMLNELGAKKIATRWIPHELNIGNMQTRVDFCQENLNMHRTSSDMLDRIIAIDESWLKSYDPQDAP